MSDHDHQQIFEQNKDQYDKIHALTDRVSKLEACMESIKTDLIGVTGNNGLRGEFRTYREGSEKREVEIVSMISDLRDTLKGMDASREASRRWLFGIMIASPAAAVAVVTLISRVFS
jgi:hypothetical protein